jgi:hypothetical protein
MSFFGVDVPQSSEVMIKIRFIAGRGKPFVAWEGSAGANEAEVQEEICRSSLVCSYIKRAAENNRLKPDEEGVYRVPAKMAFYDSGQLLEEKSTEIPVHPIESGQSNSASADATALDVIKTMAESLTAREEHMQRMVDQVNRMHESYERAIAAISKNSLDAMDKVSSHAATAFSAAAAPFAEMGKSLVKAIDDCRTQSSTSAKESQELLIEALKNRIVETNQISKPSIAQDIKDVMQLLPMLQGFLGQADAKPQS